MMHLFEDRFESDDAEGGCAYKIACKEDWFEEEIPFTYDVFKVTCKNCKESKLFGKKLDELYEGELPDDD